MSWQEPVPQEVSTEFAVTQSANYSDECIRRCPQLHQCAVSALIRLAVEGGPLVDLLTKEIKAKQESGDLPTYCELGPTSVSGGDVRPGGYRVRVAKLEASTFWGLDAWDHPVATVCQIDREKLINGHRMRSPWEQDDFQTGLFGDDLKTEFRKS